VVHDLHPDYYSTRVAGRIGPQPVTVQHHLAHVAACIAEHGLDAPLLGVAWDGTGDGGDGTVWGGEFLHVTTSGWRRVGHLRSFRLPGGEAAVREPRRSALGLLHAMFGSAAFAMTDLAPVAAFNEGERAVLSAMLDRGVNAPATTSAGRLFDAVAALLGLRQRSAYEGQAAMELEWAADCGNRRRSRHYAFPIRRPAPDEPIVVDWEPAVRAVLADTAAGVEIAPIARGFHTGLAGAIADVAAVVGEPTVVLTGGCFQNALLSEAAIAALRERGMTPVWHERVPPNDGGLALGQAFWAARS
jgi:hydrogenase maturation protein HypF